MAGNVSPGTSQIEEGKMVIIESKVRMGAYIHNPSNFSGGKGERMQIQSQFG